jgi:D-proline reductase (dithiol) PrdB
MARLEALPELERRFLEDLDCPAFESDPWVDGPPLSERRIAIISTAGLHRKEDRPFTLDPGDYYRVIPGRNKAGDLVMSHVSTNFDRSGYQQDWNVVFPLDRLNELCEQKVVGSVAEYHYSFMGAHDPVPMESAARDVAGLLKGDRVDAALLIPV